MSHEHNADKLPTLASKVLADHQRAPQTPFYDLFSLGTLFDSSAVVLLDEAYAELERRGLVERVPGDGVSFGGNVRPTFRVRSGNESPLIRRDV